MKVTIIGAGIGGLTLAVALKQKNPAIEVDIYESDAGGFSRRQGYDLGLKGDSGLRVLTSLGLRDKVLTDNAVKVTNFVFTNQAGKELLALPARDEERLTYRVEREHLKKVLLGALDQIHIHYGKKCVGYEQSNGKITAVFDNNESVMTDYLIAGDGVASAIRAQMIGDEKQYLGLGAIVGFAPIEIESPLLSGGYFMTLGDNGGSFFAYRQPGGVHFSYTSHASNEQYLTRLSVQELRTKLVSETQGWHALVGQIVAMADPQSLLVRGYYDKQPIKTSHDGNVWLLGDAAHPMCPFQGQGANMAMVDALKIADYLVGVREGAATSAMKLEGDIVKRGRKAVLESRNAARQFHTK
jgi:salicylate hydroxylase